MRNFKSLAVVLTGTLVLASCQSRGPSRPQVGIAPAAQEQPEVVGINGKWIPTDPAAQKVYYNEFRNGKFVSRSPDGSQTIAAGKYTTQTDGSIKMAWYSEARKTNASASCKKLSDSELQCSSGDSVFNLRRA